MPNQTFYGIPPTAKINPLRILRTLAGLAIIVQGVFWPQPDTTTLLVKVGAGLLLVDVTLFGAAMKAVRAGNGKGIK